MTGKTVEDLFFAADLRALGSVETADQIDKATTHEEVEEIKDRLQRLFERMEEREKEEVVRDPFPTGNIAADLRVVCGVVARDFEDAATRVGKGITSQHAEGHRGGAAMTGRRAVRQWHVEATPVLASLMSAEDRTLAAIDYPIALLACCDQLEAAFCDAEEWLYANPCPDLEFGKNFDGFIRACGGLWSVLSTGFHSDKRWVDYLADRVSWSTETRCYLQLHRTSEAGKS